MSKGGITSVLLFLTYQLFLIIIVEYMKKIRLTQKVTAGG